MAKVCELCNKRPLTGNKISHSNRKTKRRWLPNLQRAKILINGKGKTLNVCTRCLRTQVKTKAG